MWVAAIQEELPEKVLLLEDHKRYHTEYLLHASISWLLIYLIFRRPQRRRYLYRPPFTEVAFE